MFLLVILFFTTLIALLSFAKPLEADDLKDRNPAIVLATHGTTDPVDLVDLLSLENRIKDAFPCYDIHMSFMNRKILQVWRDRAKDSNFKKYFPQVSERFYNIKNPIATLGLIQDLGPRLVLMQPLQLIDGPEYHDLVSIVENLRKIKCFDRYDVPFPWIGLGGPALGLGDGQKENLFRVANALAYLFNQAKELKAAVVLIADLNGGVNPGVYNHLKLVLRNNYDCEIHVGLPESRQGIREILGKLEKKLPPPGPILMAPLTLVMGQELREDLNGPQPDSWVNLIKASGYSVVTHMEGLGSNEIFSEIFVETLKRLEEAVSRRYTD
ncbi:MAG: sirohydrochlorin cobaltochelatase [Deltaproteobacteria bacterium]|jgi:sirohydrochlorin cobaltochelatase|nr:sirohydrochlorin cobaltochelatase [Deltaproteobacteria bacterium]